MTRAIITGIKTTCYSHTTLMFHSVVNGQKQNAYQNKNVSDMTIQVDLNYFRSIPETRSRVILNTK